MNQKVVLFILTFLFIFNITQAYSCSFSIEPQTTLSGLELTNDNNVILSTIIPANSNSEKKIALNLQSKTISPVTNEKIFYPKNDNENYKYNFTYDLLNETYYNVTLNLYNSQVSNIFNCSIEVFGVNSTISQDNSFVVNRIKKMYNSNLFVSKKLNRLYFYNPLIAERVTIQSVSLENSSVSIYNITIIYSGSFWFDNIELFDNQSILYYPINYETNCEGYYYYSFNESTIWKKESSIIGNSKFSVLNTKTNTFYELWGIRYEVKIVDLNGTVTYDWIIDQNAIKDHLYGIPVNDIIYTLGSIIILCLVIIMAKRIFFKK